MFCGFDADVQNTTEKINEEGYFILPLIWNIYVCVIIFIIYKSNLYNRFFNKIVHPPPHSNQCNTGETKIEIITW